MEWPDSLGGGRVVGWGRGALGPRHFSDGLLSSLSLRHSELGDFEGQAVGTLGRGGQDAEDVGHMSTYLYHWPIGN